MAGWNWDPLPADSSPINLSFLNDTPAGNRGFVRAAGEQLVFDDGSPARFWGVNLEAGALFRTRPDLIALHAERIAQLGFNLVRLHHHDSMAWVRPSVINGRLRDSQHLNESALERLDLWISEFRRHGVYIWLDLHTGRVFKKGDRIPGYEDLHGSQGGEAKGFAYVSARLQELMMDFNARFLGHVNRETGIAYKDDPAIIGVLLTNENDLTSHFGSLLQDRQHAHHHELYRKGAREFSDQTGLHSRDLVSGRPGTDTQLWLSELEHRFNRVMIAQLRAIGFRGLVATTNLWGGAGLKSLPSLSDGDVIDAHAYGMPNALRSDPRTWASFVSRIATAQLLERPVTVSEWNLNKPLAGPRYTAPVFLSAVASLQSWDAPMLFGYSHRPMQAPGRPIPWASFMDPAVMGLMPAAAVLFRAGHVSPAKRLYVLEPTLEELLSEHRTAGRIPALRTLVEQSRVAIRLPEAKEIPWLKSPKPPEGSIRVRDLDRSHIPDSPEVTSVTSDTGEIRRDWAAPLFVVDTGMSQIASGALGAGPVTLSRARFDIGTSEATVALTSLDGLALERSSKILISALGRACPGVGKGMHYRSEPVQGSVALRREPDAPLLTLSALARPSPPRERPIPAGKLITIPLRDPTAHWYLLAERSQAGAADLEIPPAAPANSSRRAE